MTFSWNPWWYMPSGMPAARPADEFGCATHFCGAGGDAAGAVLAGVKPVMAINHWSLAIESHAANHPWCEHDVNDLLEVPPSRYAPTWGAWFSPECTTWSQARGKQRDFS